MDLTKLTNTQTLVILADGTVRIYDLNKKMHGMKIIACVVGWEVPDYYIAQEITPRMARGGSMTWVDTNRSSDISPIKAGDTMTIGDMTCEVASVADVPSPDGIPVVNITATVTGKIKPETESPTEADLPEYATIRGTAVQHIYKRYHRPAGNWEVRFMWKDGNLVVDEPMGRLKHLHETPIIACSKEDFLKDNEGYV